MNENSALALVTGASSGIGRDFSRLLAAKGLDLLIIARREDRLLELKAELETAYDVAVHPLTVDLADGDADDRMYAEVQRINQPLKWLVNNAGYNFTGRFDENLLEDYETFNKVMMSSPVALTHKLIPNLKAAAPAYIVNVASIAAFLPGTPGAGVYPASKAFLKSFTEMLAAELKQYQINATASCPGVTKTEIFDAMTDSSATEKVKNMPGMSSLVVAQQAIDAAEKGTVVIVHGLPNKILAYMLRVLPLPLSRYLVSRAYGLEDD